MVAVNTPLLLNEPSTNVPATNRPIEVVIAALSAAFACVNVSEAETVSNADFRFATEAPEGPAVKVKPPRVMD